MSELKPCPFCGGEYTQVRYIGGEWQEPSAFESGYRGECCSCHAITAAYDTEAEAAEAWNTRHVETCRLNELDALTQTLSMVNGCAWNECSKCGCLTPDDSTYCINCGRKVEDG